MQIKMFYDCSKMLDVMWTFLITSLCPILSQLSNINKYEYYFLLLVIKLMIILIIEGHCYCMSVIY